MTDKRLPRPRDPVQLGKLIGDILTGQVEDRAPTQSDPTKDQAAVVLGRKGGLKGGKARAAKARSVQISTMRCWSKCTDQRRKANAVTALRSVSVR